MNTWGDTIWLLNEKTVETVVLLSQQKPDDTIEVEKALDQLAWVRAINNIRNAAEEIVLIELIYS